MPLAEKDHELRAILSQARTIAVLGAHPEAKRPAHYVPRYLADHGYQVLPVNAVKADQQLFGAQVKARLTELDQPVDMVLIFRHADKLMEHLDELLGMKQLPRVVWLQLGISNDAFAAKLTAQGLTVVQDHCAKAEHERLLAT